MGMKVDNAQARWDRMVARLNKTMEEISKRMDASDQARARRKAVHRKIDVHRQIDRNLRSITKKLDALIAYVNRPASAPR